MSPKRKTKEVAEFGDFQTPLTLARLACKVLARRRFRPEAIIEPTCGQGSFLQAALEKFPDVSKALGVEINKAYVLAARHMLQSQSNGDRAEIAHGDFFATDWPTLLAELPEPLLVIGNPPWVTNAELGSLGSSNLPKKTNFQGHAGLDALTGKANFDISEWMLTKLLEWLNGRRAIVAMLCKTAVARKVLSHAWTNDVSLRGSAMHLIDADRHFGASVDACLLVCDLTPKCHNPDCHIYAELGDARKSHSIGYRDGRLMADVQTYEKLKHLRGQGAYRWRSGVKHDCSRVMELRRQGSQYVNGLSETVDLEDRYLFPLLKSSEVANGRTASPTRWMLVTQRSVGEDTSGIEALAPKTWEYLLRHGDKLDRRASSIYRKRPRFSVFGVGDYSFAPYKVAISGFYNSLHFAVIGNHGQKPVVVDDTVYFLPCQSAEEAEYVSELLNSDVAQEFFSAFVFWDNKRPITVDVLKQLDLALLAKELGTADTLARFLEDNARKRSGGSVQLELFSA